MLANDRRTQLLFVHKHPGGLETGPQKNQNEDGTAARSKICHSKCVEKKVSKVFVLHPYSTFGPKTRRVTFVCFTNCSKWPPCAWSGVYLCTPSAIGSAANIFICSRFVCHSTFPVWIFVQPFSGSLLVKLKTLWPKFHGRWYTPHHPWRREVSWTLIHPTPSINCTFLWDGNEPAGTNMNKPRNLLWYWFGFASRWPFRGCTKPS